MFRILLATLCNRAIEIILLDILQGRGKEKVSCFPSPGIGGRLTVTKNLRTSQMPKHGVGIRGGRQSIVQ